MEGWKECKFEELFEQSLRNGVMKPSKIRGVGYRMINMKEIFAYDFIDDNTPMELVPLSEKELQNFLLRDRDLLFARQSLIASGAGKVSIFRGNSLTTYESHLIRCRINQRKAKPEYLYYIFKSSYGRRLMDGIINQVAAAGIRGSDLKELILEIPPLLLQHRIAEILGVLDDKIELNRQMNHTLEQMAKALYKHYFVDDIDTENLPEGWSFGLLRNLVSIFTGKSLKRDLIEEKGKYPVYGANGIIGYTNQYLNDGSFILTGRVGTLGTFQLVDGKFWISDNVLSISPHKQEYFYYTFFVLKTFDFESLNRGSTQPLVTQTDLKDQTIIIPSLESADDFQTHCSSYFHQIFNNLHEIQMLSSIRDTLLPKFISGELVPSDLQPIEQTL